MRLIGALIVLALVLFLAVTSLIGTHVVAQKHAAQPAAGATAPAVTGANARGIVGQAQSQLQQNEAAGQSNLQRGITGADGQP